MRPKNGISRRMDRTILPKTERSLRFIQSRMTNPTLTTSSRILFGSDGNRKSVFRFTGQSEGGQLAREAKVTEGML